MTDEMFARPLPTAIPPTSGAAGGVAKEIRDRRKKLVRHGIDSGHMAGIPLAGAALARMHEIANGHTPSLRCDRPTRHRISQFLGDEPMPLEDITAMGEESQLGRDVAVAGLCEILNRWGIATSPMSVEDRPEALLRSAGAVAKDAGALVEAVNEAETDRRITPAEADDITRRARKLAQDVEVTARVAAHRVGKDQR